MQMLLWLLLLDLALRRPQPYAHLHYTPAYGPIAVPAILGGPHHPAAVGTCVESTCVRRRDLYRASANELMPRRQGSMDGCWRCHLHGQQPSCCNCHRAAGHRQLLDVHRCRCHARACHHLWRPSMLYGHVLHAPRCDPWRHDMSKCETAPMWVWGESRLHLAWSLLHVLLGVHDVHDMLHPRMYDAPRRGPHAAG
jgi:hypothetical protein